MKKYAHLSSSLAAVILGVLLFFYSFFYFEIGDICILIGVFALIAGLSCLTFAIFDIVGLNNKVKVLSAISGYALLFAFPLYQAVYSIAVLVEGAGSFNFVGWIELMLVLSGAFAFAGLHVAGKLSKVKVLSRISVLCSFVFITGILLSYVFSLDGMPMNIGSIIVPDVLMLACYGYILFGVIKNNPEDNNTQEVQEEKKEEEKEQPQEEVAE